MLKRLIVFLIRKKLKLKLNETFRFVNQKSPNNYYFFTRDGLQKMEYIHPDPFYPNGRRRRPSSVSLNWLLDDKCKITIVDKPTTV